MIENKNILLFIIDSLNYSHVKQSDIELMPFLNELKKTGISCENMYSQAPYTEAAVMNLYCGQDVLDNGGYILRFKNAKKTIFEVMKEHGYKTYYNSYQPQCHPSSVRRGIDDLYYNVGYDLGALWSYRLGHYAELYKRGALSEIDYRTLYEIFDDNFSEWIRFIDDVLSKNNSVSLINGNDAEYKPQKVKEAVTSQYAAYLQDKKIYINDILTNGKSHPIFFIPAYVQHNKIKDRTILAKVKEEYRPLLKRIKRMNTRLNLQNTRGLANGTLHKFGNAISHPGKVTVKELTKSAYLMVNEILDLDLFQRINEDCDWFKNAPSGISHINHYIKWAKSQEKAQPHFACIHIDDIHNPEEFFTYDSENMDLLCKEKRDAEELLDKIPTSYHGNITHELSLRYIDNVLKYLYESMAAEKLLDNTCIVICADHGFSFSGNPIRDSFVINLYLENYNIPCVITGAGIDGKRIEKLCTSKDIPATICDLAFGNVPEEFTGISVLKDDEYTCVDIEYCGGGCPDLYRRELKIAAFNKEYFVGTLGMLDEPLDDKMITEVYNLHEDPFQMHNLAKKHYDENLAKPLIEAIKKRKESIKSTMPS